MLTNPTVVSIGHAHGKSAAQVGPPHLGVHACGLCARPQHMHVRLPKSVRPLSARSQVALRWVTQQGIMPVTASAKSSHLASDLAIFDFTLSEAEMEALKHV